MRAGPPAGGGGGELGTVGLRASLILCETVQQTVRDHRMRHKRRLRRWWWLSCCWAGQKSGKEKNNPEALNNAVLASKAILNRSTRPFFKLRML